MVASIIPVALRHNVRGAEQPPQALDCSALCVALCASTLPTVAEQVFAAIASGWPVEQVHDWYDVLTKRGLHQC